MDAEQRLDAPIEQSRVDSGLIPSNIAFMTSGVYRHDHTIDAPIASGTVRESRLGREWTVTVKDFCADQVEFIRGKNQVSQLDVQDLTLDAALSRTQYQFVLENPNLSAFDTWVPKLIDQLNKKAPAVTEPGVPAPSRLSAVAPATAAVVTLDLVA